MTEPGEPAKGKKNGLDYLFDLYEQCGKFLEEVQQIAKEKGEKCPTKVTTGLVESGNYMQHLDYSVFDHALQIQILYSQLVLVTGSSKSLKIRISKPVVEVQQCLFSLLSYELQVTNEVFRHAKLTGAGYINKPKMRDYVHCYALHCLDMEQSNALRKVYKERGENVGQWCQACYYPLVLLARGNGWDIDDLFNRNEKLRIWYVPAKLRHLCHMERIKHGE